MKDKRPILKLDGKTVGRLTEITYSSDENYPLICRFRFAPRDALRWHSLFEERAKLEGRWAVVHQGHHRSRIGVWSVVSVTLGPDSDCIEVSLNVESRPRIKCA